MPVGHSTAQACTKPQSSSTQHAASSSTRKMMLPSCCQSSSIICGLVCPLAIYTHRFLNGVCRKPHLAGDPTTAAPPAWSPLCRAPGTNAGSSLASYRNSAQSQRCTFFFIITHFFLQYNYYSPLMELISIKLN